MAKWKVLITDKEYENINNEKAVLEKIGAEIFVFQEKKEERIIEILKDVKPDAIIVQFAPITRRVIECMPQCKIIAKYAIGYDNVDVAAATEHNICVTNVLDYCVDEVSTHTVALLLCMLRKITVLNSQVKSGVWGYNNVKKIHSLHTMVLGLNSFGKIARLTAEKMKPFGVKMIAYDPYVPAELMQSYGVEQVSFDELIERSDILSNHVGVTDSTRGMFNWEVFKKMKQNAFIINTGRGPVINEPDLIRALESKEIAGAALDVLDPEPVQKNNPLLGMDNVIITPHMAYYTEESLGSLQRMAAENVAQRLEGFMPRYFVNREISEKLGLKKLID